MRWRATSFIRFTTTLAWFQSTRLACGYDSTKSLLVGTLAWKYYLRYFAWVATLDISKELKELRLMGKQPGYRFVLMWSLVVLRVGVRYVAIPLTLMYFAHQSGLL